MDVLTHMAAFGSSFGTSKELGFKLRVCKHSLMNIRPTMFHGICLLGIWSGSASFRMMHYILTKNIGDLSDKIVMS